MKYVVKTCIAVLLCMCSLTTQAQNVRREGNTFIQQSAVGDSTATSYYYQDAKGIKYPIFISAKGKAYCWVKSSKTGKMYRKYLPKITKMLSKK